MSFVLRDRVRCLAIANLRRLRERTLVGIRCVPRIQKLDEVARAFEKIVRQVLELFPTVERGCSQSLQRIIVGV